MTINATVETSISGAFIATIFENSTALDSRCYLIPGYGSWPKSFALDLFESSFTGSKNYTLEARFKLGVSSCGASSAYPDAVATAPYQVNWQPDSCNPPHGTQLLLNGSFENRDWIDLNESIQQPKYWTISWVPNGQPLYDETGIVATGTPEFTHKEEGQLPLEERICQPKALILDGIRVYKIFNPNVFGGEMKQIVSGLTPGMSVKLTVPMLLITNSDTDPYGSASGVWINGEGGWAWALDMGNRSWYYHQRTITVPGNGQVELLIRMKSKWGGVDFFIDDVRLEPN